MNKSNALETELVGVTFDKKQLAAVDAMLQKLNAGLSRLQHYNRQDFIRMAVAEKLLQTPRTEVKK